MRRLVPSLLIAALLTLAALTPVAAHFGTEPCDTGQEYAQEHVAHEAMLGELGQVHTPGSHQGFANVPDVCN
jgi:hypothetical protein